MFIFYTIAEDFLRHIFCKLKNLISICAGGEMHLDFVIKMRFHQKIGVSSSGKSLINHCGGMCFNYN